MIPGGGGELRAGGVVRTVLGGFGPRVDVGRGILGGKWNESGKVGKQWRKRDESIFE